MRLTRPLLFFICITSTSTARRQVHSGFGIDSNELDQPTLQKEGDGSSDFALNELDLTSDFLKCTGAALSELNTPVDGDGLGCWALAAAGMNYLATGGTANATNIVKSMKHDPFNSVYAFAQEYFSDTSGNGAKLEHDAGSSPFHECLNGDVLKCLDSTPTDALKSLKLPRDHVKGALKSRQLPGCYVEGAGEGGGPFVTSNPGTFLYIVGAAAVFEEELNFIRKLSQKWEDESLDTRAMDDRVKAKLEELRELIAVTITKGENLVAGVVDLAFAIETTGGIEMEQVKDFCKRMKLFNVDIFRINIRFTDLWGEHRAEESRALSSWSRTKEYGTYAAAGLLGAAAAVSSLVAAAPLLAVAHLSAANICEDQDIRKGRVPIPIGAVTATICVSTLWTFGKACLNEYSQYNQHRKLADEIKTAVDYEQRH